MRLLVVDDSDLMVERIQGLLSELPELEVVGIAADPAAAINLINSESPDTVILDVQLGAGSGLQVLRYIQTQRLKMHTVVLSNFSDALTRMVYAHHGADCFLDKSYEYSKLADEILRISS